MKKKDWRKFYQRCNICRGSFILDGCIHASSGVTRVKTCIDCGNRELITWKHNETDTFYTKELLLKEKNSNVLKN